MKTFLDLSQVADNLTGVVILGFTIWNLRFAIRSFRTQMNAQVYLAYTDRYERLMADSPLDFRTSLLNIKLAEVEAKDRDLIKLCMLRYINLCSEEFHLKQSGHLSPEVWELWKGEMESTLRTPLYVWGWSELKPPSLSHPEFFNYVERVQDPVTG